MDIFEKRTDFEAKVYGYSQNLHDYDGQVEFISQIFGNIQSMNTLADAYGNGLEMP